MLAGLALAGCATSGTKVDPTTVQAFRQGVTTYGDVLAALGPANSTSLLPDGSRMLVYAYIHGEVRPQSFIPLIGPFVARADTNSQSYLFQFNPQGLLVSVTSTASQATGGAGS